MRYPMRYLWIAPLLVLTCLVSVPAQAQSTCANSTLSGVYFYVVNGNVSVSGQYLPYAELGKFTADGNGGISGQSTASTGGGLGSLTFSGNYTVQGDCTGTMALSVQSGGVSNPETLTFQLISGGQSAVLALSSSTGVFAGRAVRAASTAAAPCGNGSLNGTFGYLMSGVVSLTSGTFLYSESGQVTSDGKGHITDTNVYNLGGGGATDGGTGTYTLNSDCSGTVQFTYPDGTFAYNIALGEGNNLMFLETDSGTSVAGSGQRQSVGMVLPQFVFGAGTWYSALYFTNSNSNSVSFTVNFMADAGTPLTVPSLGGSSVAVTIAPNGTAVLEAPSSGTFGQGYASVTLPTGVTGYGIFRQTVSGRPDQEAVVPLASATSTTSTLAWDETVGTVTVAIANPSSMATSVTITVWDTSGNVLGTSPLIPLAANSKTEGSLDILCGVNLTGKRGSAQFNVSTGNVAVLGLRFAGVAFTSVPANGN